MSYTKVYHTKLVRNQNVCIHNINDIITVTCNQITNTPGIRTNNVTFPKGYFTIHTNIELHNERVALWIYNIATKTEQRIFLLSGENNSNISFDETVNVHIGILFIEPKIGAHFELKKMIITSENILNADTEIVKHANLFDMIDHVYVINQDEQTDKMLKVDRYLKRLGIEYERISGCEPSQKEYENIIKDGSKIVSLSDFGHIQSHINILRNAIKNQYETILVLEDDIVPIKTFNVSNIIVPADYDILYLGCYQHDFVSQKLYCHDGYYVANKSHGTFAISIKKHMFPILIGLYSMLEMSIDMYLEKIQNKYKCYVEHENLIITDLNDSLMKYDIIEDGKNFGWDNSKYYANVSVIIPVFNGEKFLLECLESIKSQTFTDYELIIINNGSTDNTRGIISNFLINNPELIITCIDLTVNCGLSEALNIGLQKTHGKYITWISCDSKFKHDALMKMYNFLCDNKKFSLVTGGHEYVSINNDRNIISKVYGSEYTNETIVAYFHGVVSCMYTRDVMRNVGNYDTELCGLENHDFLIRILERPPYKCGCITDILTEVHKCVTQLSDSDKYDYKILQEKLLKKRQSRIEMRPITFSERVCNTIDNTKDTLIYLSNIKYDNLQQRSYRNLQILKHMNTNYNCVYVTKSNNYEKIENDIIIVSWDKFNELSNEIQKNKIILYYTDPQCIQYIDKIKHDIIIFDVSDNSKINTQKEIFIASLQIADIVTYSAKHLYSIIGSITTSLKYEPLYVPNCCDKNFMLSQTERKNINIPTTKKIVGYYGVIDSRIDFELLKIIASNQNIHVVIIRSVYDNSKCNMIFEHPNVSWLEYETHTELLEYLHKFDICMLPLLESETMKGYNPIELYEYMNARKPIISTIKFIDYPDNYSIINKKNAIVIINGIIERNKMITYPDIPYWDDACSHLYHTILRIKRTQINNNKRCAYITDTLINCDTHEPIHTGKGKYAVSIANLLKKYNIDITFYQLCLNHTKKCDNTTNICCTLKYYNFPVICVRANELETYKEFNIGYSKNVNELIKNEKYEYVIYGIPELCCSENICENSISINHGIWFNGETIIDDPKWFDLMKTHIKKTMLTVSDDTQFINFMRIFGNEVSNKINYIPNFYDATLCKYIEKDNNKINIVIPKHATTHNGTRIMNDILKQVKYDANIIWIGRGDTEDNKILETLENSDARFKFTWCSFDKIVDYYNIADIVVIPTITGGGTSFSCIEAMACGCAVIVTNVGGLCNLVIDEYNGLLVNPNAHDISAAINKLIENKQNRIKLVRNAKNIVDIYRDDKWIEKWENIFGKIGWIHKKSNNMEHDNFVTINRKEIENNFSMYWKNYIHVYELQHHITNMNDALKHFLLNENCKSIRVCNPNIRICVFVGTMIDNALLTIYEEAKYMNMDIYIINNLNDMEPIPFLFTNIKTANEIVNIIGGYDIIVYHCIPKYAQQVIQKCGIPSIEYLHGLENNNSDKDIPIKIVTQSLFMINRCYMQTMTDCILLEHPIDTTKFHPKKTNKKYIGCMCSYEPNNNIDILLHALQITKLKTELNEWEKYTIVFYGKNKNNYKKLLHDMAIELGIQCEFNEPTDEIEYINNYELIIIPSKSDILPLVLLEAIACNVHVIASDTVEINEFYNIAVERGYKNLFQLFKSGDILDLSQKLDEWLCDPYGTTYGYEYIKKFYSSDIHCNKFANIMDQCVSKRIIEKRTNRCESAHNISTYIVSDSDTKQINGQFRGANIGYNKCLRIVTDISNDCDWFELQINVDGIIEPVIMDYQFKIIGKNASKYSSDTLTIVTNGTKSIHSSKLSLSDITQIQINLSSKSGCVTINSIDIKLYY